MDQAYRGGKVGIALLWDALMGVLQSEIADFAFRQLFVPQPQSVSILVSPRSRISPRALHAPRFLGLQSGHFRAFPISDAFKPACRELKRLYRFIELS